MGTSTLSMHEVFHANKILSRLSNFSSFAVKAVMGEISELKIFALQI